MSDLKITHTPADGTMLEGTRKGDGAWEAIKAAQATYRVRGWRYMPSIRMIGVSHSRDRAPHLGLIDTTAEVLREAGFTVTVEVDAAPRAMEEAETDRADRMDDRAEHLAAKATHKAGEAEARWAAADAIAEHIPPGQPILRGHHSERGHRRDLARMDGHMRKSLELGVEAERAAHGAATAQRHMDLREAPGRVARRLERLTADRRKVQRGLDGHIRNHRRHDGTIYHVSATPAATGRHREQLDGQAAHLDEQVRHWTGILGEHRAAGRWNPADPATISKGDLVQVGGGPGGRWYAVLRVNRKTLRVDTGRGSMKLDLTSVTGHRTAAQVAGCSDAVAAELDELSPADALRGVQ